MKEKKEINILDIQVNIVYLLSTAIAIILNNVEWELKKQGDTFKKEKKQKFNQLIQAIQRVKFLEEQLDKDILGYIDEGNYKEHDDWRKSANEVIRLLLLYFERCDSNIKRKKRVFDFISKYKSKLALLGKEDEYLKRFLLK